MRKTLVVGASSGIGAALASAALAAGDAVTVSARRAEQLEVLVDGCEHGYAVAGDATSPDDMARVVADAALAMGGLDLVVYAAGYGVISPLVDTDPEVWADIFQVNVVGANLCAAAAIDVMDSDGVVAFISSRATQDHSDYFASYTSTKAALDTCIQTWRHEHPERRFVRVVMGNVGGTEFANHMGDGPLGDALTRWVARGIPLDTMDLDRLGSALYRSLVVAVDDPEVDINDLRFDAR